MAGIDNIRSGQSLATNTRTTARADTQSKTPLTQQDTKTSQTTQQDAVSLSAQGKAIGGVQSDFATNPSFDSAKVASIKEAIANGSYVVDAEKLAENMIRFEKELGGL